MITTPYVQSATSLLLSLSLPPTLSAVEETSATGMAVPGGYDEDEKDESGGDRDLWSSKLDKVELDHHLAPVFHIIYTVVPSSGFVVEGNFWQTEGLKQKMRVPTRSSMNIVTLAMMISGCW